MNEARKKLRFITQVLYSLKRDFGGRVDIYSPETTITNIETGAMSTTRTMQTVRRAIILESKSLEKHIYGLTFIAANKNFSYGASFEENSRLFIFDAKDLTSPLAQDQYLVYNARRYEIKNIQEFEFNKGYMVLGSELKGALPRQVFNLSAASNITFGSGVSNEL